MIGFRYSDNNTSVNGRDIIEIFTVNGGHSFSPNVIFVLSIEFRFLIRYDVLLLWVPFGVDRD